MKLNIIIPYRPLGKEGMGAPHGDSSFELRQDAEECWSYPGGGEPALGGVRRYGEKDELKRAIKYLIKNSTFKHNIIVAIDPDVYPHEKYLKEFDNLSFIKHSETELWKMPNRPYWKLNAALMGAINSVPDEEWLCYDYISDLICSKDWDKYIVEAIKEHGDDKVYVPMFTEVRRAYCNIELMGLNPTPQKIWDEWRRTVCCHALTMPLPQKGYFDEGDMDYYIKIANETGNKIFSEPPGARVYGYFAVMIMKAKYAKKAIRLEGSGFDLFFDNRLSSECNLNKIVVARSFVFHPFCAFKEK